MIQFCLRLGKLFSNSQEEKKKQKLRELKEFSLFLVFHSPSVLHEYGSWLPFNYVCVI